MDDRVSVFFDSDFNLYSIEEFKDYIKDKKIVFFGASTRLKPIINDLPENQQILYICDSDKSKWERCYEDTNIKIISPEELYNINDDNIVVVTVIRELSLSDYIKNKFKWFFETVYIGDDINFLKENQFFKSNIKIQMENKKYKYIHFMPDEKVTRPFINLLVDKFDFEEHFFIISGVRPWYKNWDFYKELKDKYGNIYIIGDLKFEGFGKNELLTYLYLNKIKNIFANSFKIIFHSFLFIYNRVLIYFLEEVIKEYSDKTAWIIWGGDARFTKNSPVGELINNVKEIYYSQYDFKFLYDDFKKNYDISNFKIINADLTYSGYFKKESLVNYVQDKKDYVSILVGHFGIKIDKHLDVFDEISKFKDENIRVYCPLSYGEKDYIEEVKRRGKEIFGEKFYSLDEYISFEKYMEFLYNIDVVIMACDISAGIQGLKAALYFGKKVYTPKGKAIWDRFEILGFKLYDYYNLKNEDFNNFISDNNYENNKSVAESLFDINAVAEKWREVFKANILFNKALYLSDSLDYIKDAANRRISGDGKYTKLCSELMENKFSANKVLLTTSCTSALEMTALLLDIKEGDEIIMPSYTFVSTANAFVLRGAKIVFVDIRPDTMNIDENLIEAAVTNKTKALVVVHYAGVSCEMDKINKIANKYNLVVIEDAAQGVMSKYKDKYLGTIGDLGCYSFHETKNYTMGEGGALVINNMKYLKNAEIIREKGTNRARFFRGEVDKYSWVEKGSSYLPSDLNAAYLYTQLKIADKINDKRLELWDTYNSNLTKLKNLGIIELPFIPDNCKHNAHMFYIKAKSLEERTKLIAYLREKGIGSVFHYVPLHSSEAGLKYSQFFGKDVYTTFESERLVRLPMYYNLSKEEVIYVIKNIFDFYNVEF